MAIEIERKFLVNSTIFKLLGTPHRISQGYICSHNDRVVRIRTYDNKALLTIKNATIGFSRNEYEYEIPLQDARDMLHNTCMSPIIEKTRYILEHAGHTWEIDEFHGDNQGLIVAEIELENENETFEKPPFITTEVTNQDKYYNALLFKHPYSKW